MADTKAEATPKRPQPEVTTEKLSPDEVMAQEAAEKEAAEKKAAAEARTEYVVMEGHSFFVDQDDERKIKRARNRPMGAKAKEGDKIMLTKAEAKKLRGKVYRADEDD